MSRTFVIRGSAQAALTQLDAIAVSVQSACRLQGVSAREAGSGEHQVAEDEVVRIELENGFVLWSRADDLVREWGQPAVGRDGLPGWTIDLPPRVQAAATRRGERGWLGLGIKLLEFFGIDLHAKAAEGLCHAAEDRLLDGAAPGLYHCPLAAPFALVPVSEATLAPMAGPVLVFLHGTASSTQGSFGKLWNDGGAALRAKLQAVYGDRVYALQHRSLTESPIENALALVQQLPVGVELHLVSHSRGGLIGELLCLGERERSPDPLAADLLDKVFAADRTAAPSLNLGPLSPQSLAAHGDAYAADRKRLATLLAELDARKLKVGRFVRVACPASGTTLASGRLDRWLSVLTHFCHGWVGEATDFLLAVVKERTDPRTLPGLEAMMPGSALTRLLRTPGLVTASDLSVIAGDIEGDTLWGQLKLLLVDWFYAADHDLVVNTGSMFGGIQRVAQGARFLRDQGPGVCHFNYFENEKSVGWLENGLLRAEGSDGGFLPIAVAPIEAPRSREALRRSRAITAPRPLAVVLPGTMGSALQVGADPVWLEYLPLAAGGLGRLRLPPKPDAPPIRATDLLERFYGPLIEFLARSHRVELFPYDWRLSVRDAATRLADQLEAWLPECERSGQAVHLVAHSMGGLVVRAMIADGGRGAALWRRIVALPNSRFMMLGTPNLGSHEAVRWLTGHNPTQTKLNLLDLAHDIDQIIGIVNRYPGLLELLPFDPSGPDFAQATLWTGLKQQLAAAWSTADAQALLAARATWDLLRQAPVDPAHMVYVAGCQRQTVVDYRLAESRLPWLAGRKQLEFIATPAGDGTVAWQSGRLPGVATWYVEDTAHDELCVNTRAFPGLLDLLTAGTTSRLASSPPMVRGEREDLRFVLPDTPALDQMPDARLEGFGFGPARPLDPALVRHAVPVIQVRLVHGNLAHARHPVVVGHHAGDELISAAHALNERLGQALACRKQLGLYPERIGSHALFFAQKPEMRPSGALVVGLGQVGELSPGLLSKGVRDAMLDYALRVAQWPDDRFGPAGQVRSAALSCLLVGAGSRACGMTPRDSMDAILRAAIAANAKLVAARIEDKVVIDRIEFIELYEDIALQAAAALADVLRDGALAMAVSWPTGVVEAGEGGLRRVHCDDAPGWWQRLEIVEDDEDTLRFIAATDRARAEETLATGQLRLADGFIRAASQSASANPEAARTLFEMLLPNRMKALAPKEADLVLLVDRMSARYPWELLEDRWSQGSRPPAVAAGLIRQLKTPSFRPQPAHASSATALVVGNPNLGGWECFGDLPGARQEAQAVAALLKRQGYLAEDCIDAGTDTILASLHRNAWRILHLAGHGEHEFALPAEPGCTCLPAGGSAPVKRVSGMVIGRNTFLTPGDVEQMRWVPELVFINCCHLGAVTSSTAREGRLAELAANLALQFIQMGVRAVVAAGWAVDDAAAETFSTSFYTHLLAGQSFGEAVRAAREEIWVRFPGVNTWGAYQCYGDPGYRLTAGAPSGHAFVPARYYAPVELVSDLANYTAWARQRISELGEAQREAAALRQCVLEKLGPVPEDCRADWLARADVAAALGLAFSACHAWAEAIEWLDTAIAAGAGDCPLSVLDAAAQARLAWVMSARQQDGAHAGLGAQRLDEAQALLAPLVRQGQPAARAGLLEQIRQLRG